MKARVVEKFHSHQLKKHELLWRKNGKDHRKGEYTGDNKIGGRVNAIKSER